MSRVWDAVNEYIDCGDDVALGTSMSAFIWQKRNGDAGNTDYRYFDKGDSTSSAGIDWMLSSNDLDSVYPRIRLYRNGQPITIIGSAEAGTQDLLDQWDQLGMTYDGSSNSGITWYNATQNSTWSHTETTGNIGNRTGKYLRIGGSAAPYAPTPNSDFAWFTVWNVALTSAEVSALYAGANPTRIRRGNMVLCYPLWGTHSTEIDLTGNTSGTVSGPTAGTDAPPVEPYRLCYPSYFDFGGSTTVTPSAVAATWAVATPTVVKGAVTLAPSATAATWSVASPVVSNLNTLTPSAVAATYAVATPTVVKGAVTLTPTPVAATYAVAAPTVSAGAVLTPSAVATTWAVATPTVVKGTVTVTPSPVAATYAVAAPTVSVSGVVTPSAVAATYAVATPTVTAGTVTLTPSAVAATYAVATPTVTAGTVATPDPVAGTWSVAIPTVTAGAVTLTPDPIGLLWSVAAPNLGVQTIEVTPIPLVWRCVVPITTYTPPPGVGSMLLSDMDTLVSGAGEAIRHRRSTGSWTNLSAIVERNQDEIGLSPRTRKRPLYLTISKSDLGALKSRDTVEVDGVSYTVRRIVQEDTGHWRVYCVR